MAKKKRNKHAEICVPVTSPESRASLSYFGCEQSDRIQNRLYYSLRENVPVIDAAINKIIRLTGGYEVKCSDPNAQRLLNDFLMSVPVGGNREGIWSFTESYLDELLTCGTAIGEIVTDSDGNPAALYNAPVNSVEMCRAGNGFDVDLYVNSCGSRKKIERRDLCLISVLNPEPGSIYGTSLLRGLPFISSILRKIFESIGTNWDRAGNLRFAVTYNPKDNSLDRAYARERAIQIADEWSKAMKSDEVRDFVAVGDVQIKVIGADSSIPDSEVPVRQMLEQIIAKTGLPPFMLGLSWSTTERMSSQQADVLTSELESYRRILNPIITKICSRFLSSEGYSCPISIKWDDITLQDEVEQSRAELYRAQAEKIRKEISDGKQNQQIGS